MKTAPLLRLYELMGAEVDRERGTVKLESSMQARPIDIVVRVQPTGVRSQYMREATVDLRVLLDPELVFDGGVEQYSFDEELTLPGSQLRFAEDTEDARLGQLLRKVLASDMFVFAEDGRLCIDGSLWDLSDDEMALVKSAVPKEG